MTTFYVFNRDPFGSHDAHMSVYDEPARHDEAPRCPKCNRFVGMLPALPPIRAELELYGHYFGDVAFTGHQLLVSAKLRDVFIQSQFTGLSDFFRSKSQRSSPESESFETIALCIFSHP